MAIDWTKPVRYRNTKTRVHYVGKTSDGLIVVEHQGSLVRYREPEIESVFENIPDPPPAEQAELRSEVEAVNSFVREFGYGQGDIDDKGLTAVLREIFDKRVSEVGDSINCIVGDIEKRIVDLIESRLPVEQSVEPSKATAENIPDPPLETFDLEKALRMGWAEVVEIGYPEGVRFIHKSPRGLAGYDWAGNHVYIDSNGGFVSPSGCKSYRAVNSHLPEPEGVDVYVAALRAGGAIASKSALDAAALAEHERKCGNLFGTGTLRVLKETNEQKDPNRDT